MRLFDNPVNMSCVHGVQYLQGVPFIRGTIRLAEFSLSWRPVVLPAKGISWKFLQDVVDAFD